MNPPIQSREDMNQRKLMYCDWLLRKFSQNGNPMTWHHDEVENIYYGAIDMGLLDEDGKEVK